ncbi:glycosyltransferase [Melioribacteraceae bacterium 4301-Me]|uniref:glycosyltransferase n=1 Tax=Pyranulibacter aquaticus TaxID=3163344 RepID=UPI0035958C67
MIDLSIIIVNYNVKEFLLNLLDSIKKASVNLSIEIIIVDNASDDGSVELVKEKFPEVDFIVNKKNIGFGAANNLALAKARGKYFLLINPDTIVKEDTLYKMLIFFENNPQAGIAGCKVLNPDGSLQLACRRGFPGPWTSFTKVMGLSKLFPKSKLFARYNLTYLDENQTYEVDAISGAFMMMRREVYEKIGGFDTQFFMYGEDLDLCYRAQSAGFKVYYVHSTEIIHYKGESTKRSNIDETKYFYDAMHMFVRKHLATSFFVESMLRLAIIFRKFFAFLNIYKLPIASMCFDLILFTTSVYISEKIYKPGHWTGFPHYVIPWIYFVPSLFQVIISGLTGTYNKTSLSVLKTVLSLFYGLVILSSLTFFFKQFAFSRAVILITYGIVFILFSSWRIIFKVIFKVGLISETRKINTLIVGAGEKSIKLAQKLKSNLSKLYNIVGLVSLSRKEIGETHGSYKVIGALENIKKIISDKKIDLVIFSSEQLTFNQMFGVVSECQGLTVDFLVAGKEIDYLVGKSSVLMLDDIPLLRIEYNISSFLHRFIKSLFDFVFSFFILLFVYPFIYLFCLITKRRSNFTNFVLQVPLVILRKKSLVGPKENSYHNGLYVGLPGLTGLWFTELVDSNDSEELKKLDVFYAKNYNIWLDLEILGRTFSKMILGRRD